VTITATPASGYQFTGFTGSVNSSSTSLTVTMNGAMNETANFQAIGGGFVLTTSIGSSGGGSVSPNCSGGCSYGSGAQVSITATPVAGYQFTGFTGTVNNSSNPLTVTMSAATTETANFVPVYPLVTTVNQAGGGSISPYCPSGCFYPSGTQVTITATPNGGYHFYGLTGTYNKTANPYPITINGPVTEMAHFEIQGQVVSEYHVDDRREGVSIDTVLNPSTVSNLQSLYTLSPDGTAVYAQPLYLSNITTTNCPSGCNVVFVATEGNTVAAYNADSGALLWQTNLGYPFYADQFYCGRTPCTHIPVSGITSTPVIDQSTGTLYLVALTATSDTGSPACTTVEGNWCSWYTAYGLDIHTGNNLKAYTFPAQVTTTTTTPSGTIMVTKDFDPRKHVQRAGLAFGHGNLFVAFADFYGEDGGAPARPSYGLMFQLNTSPLSLAYVFDTEPSDTGGGIWMGGGAPSFDAYGNLYFTVANCGYGGQTSCNPPSYDNSLVRLGPGWNPSSCIAGQMNSVCWQYKDTSLQPAGDLDLGSSDVVIFNNPYSSSVLAATAGKQGEIYVFDVTNPSGTLNPVGPLLPSTEVASIFGSLAYFNGAVYVARSGGDTYDMTSNVLQAYAIQSNNQLCNPGQMYCPQNSVGTDAFLDFSPSPVPSISASNFQNTDGSGIVWLVAKRSGDPSDMLLGYLASNVSQRVFQSPLNTDGVHDPHFGVPTIADGKVFVPTYSGVQAFGFLFN
jgi:hypothetical protein